MARDEGVSDVAGWLDLTSTFGEAVKQRRDGGGGGSG